MDRVVFIAEKETFVVRVLEKKVVDAHKDCIFVKNTLSDVKEVLTNSELSILKSITDRNSTLAEEINNYSFIYKHIGNFRTKVKTKKLYDDIKSTIIISYIMEDLIFTKNKNSDIIKVYPTYSGKEKFLRRHFDTICNTFDQLENYTELIGNIDDNMYCFMYDLNPIFCLRIYYNLFGYIKPEIYIRKGIEENEHYNNESIKRYVNLNINSLLKKVSFDINSDLSMYDSNKILLLAKKSYNKQRENEKIKVKSINN